MSVEDIANGLNNFFSSIERPIYLHEPDLKGHELSYITDCIESGWVSSVGSYVDRFEKELGEFCGGYAVSTVNGTAALHLALVLAGVKPNHEVITPALTFVATANAVSYCGAIPHFVDADSQNFGIDAAKLDVYLSKTLKNGVNIKTGRKISALIVTHIFGHCADMDALSNIAKKYNLVLVEDAAESLGSYYKGKHTGLLGIVSALSFNGNKILTTGGGGAVLTSDQNIAERAKHLSTTAKATHPYVHIHDEIGYNYRMPNINAALGCGQLEKLPDYLAQKKILTSRYSAFFAQFPDTTFVKQPDETISNNWLNSIIMNSEEDRNTLIDILAKNDIFCRGIWEVMAELPMYKNCPSMDISTAKDLVARTVNLPSSPFLAKRL